MRISGETMIFKNDIGYSTTISNKKEDGSYDNMSISVNFKKDIEVPNKTRINVVDGFMSFYRTKDGLPRVKLVVLEFEAIGQAEVKEKVPVGMSNEEIIEEDDLPF